MDVLFLKSSSRKSPYPQSRISEWKTTTHPSLFSEFFRRFFGEEISLPPYLDDVFSMGNINTHASEQNSGYDELFSSWPKWQQVAFSHKVSELKLIEVYKNVNYNLFTYG